ncbi:hypothetical protein M413DRAFT_14714 [Hebeloma cylindrosporum]|uniref:Uncharacterized protein n=1 Tax=Hebeloma cylindrosporum TaxID=76867 RepID=A0A0C3BST7_HEBCY|nr:hypothetical protein M413DRAFT_14714 [Hebeloma cylindrosporum h7]
MSFMQQRPRDGEYKLYIRLSGTSGPINSLAFAPDAKFLASGGDDQKVRVWDISCKQIYQVIGDDLERWGQITCVLWLTTTSDTICFGTARGLVLIYQRTKEADQFKEVSSTAVLPFNEPVEGMDYDRSKGRLALTSHTGRIKLFQIEKNGTLLALWSKNWNEIQEARGVIPRSIRFTEKGENVAIFGLESGVM